MSQELESLPSASKSRKVSKAIFERNFNAKTLFNRAANTIHFGTTHGEYSADIDVNNFSESQISEVSDLLVGRGYVVTQFEKSLTIKW